MKISACIVVYNSNLPEICDAIDTFLLNQGAAIILVNNKSETDIFQQLLSKYKNIQSVYFADLEKNEGFGFAHNFGFNELLRNNKLGDYHIILNPDVYILPNALNILCDFMQNNSHIGIVVPKVLNQDYSLQPLNKEHPNVLDMIIRRFLPNFLIKLKYFDNRYKKYIRADVGYESICHVPFASGCFMFFRSDIFKKLGGFDEKMFLYMEDADISRRCWSFSDVVYNPNAQIIHIWKRSSHKNIRMTFIFIKSAIYYFNKHGWKFL